MSGYTKGPWIVQKRQDEDEGTLVKHVGENDDFLICETNMNWRFAKNNAANARLIAAAPELLEALEEAVDVMEKFGIKDGGIPTMKQLIKKAKGE